MYMNTLRQKEKKQVVRLNKYVKKKEMGVNSRAGKVNRGEETT